MKTSEKEIQAIRMHKKIDSAAQESFIRHEILRARIKSIIDIVKRDVEMDIHGIINTAKRGPDVWNRYFNSSPMSISLKDFKSSVSPLAISHELSSTGVRVTRSAL